MLLVVVWLFSCHNESCSRFLLNTSEQSMLQVKLKPLGVLVSQYTMYMMCMIKLVLENTSIPLISVVFWEAYVCNLCLE